jgi:hypothetical protein
LLAAAVAVVVLVELLEAAAVVVPVEIMGKALNLVMAERRLLAALEVLDMEFLVARYKVALA